MKDCRKLTDLEVWELIDLLEQHFEILLSYEQVSILLNTSRAHVTQLVHEGKLKSVKGFGTKCKFIAKSDVERYICRTRCAGK